MSTKKIVLLVLGGVAVVVVALVYSARQWWRANEAGLRQSLEQGRAAGASLAATQCVDTVLMTHRGAPGLAATFSQSIFLNGCLEKSHDLPALCQQDTNPGVMTSAQWLVGICRAHGLTDQYCGTVLQPLVTSCRKLREHAT